MKKNVLFLLFSLFTLSCINLRAQTYYHDQKLHLTFTLDETTKEAMVGTGLDLDMANAISYPPLGDNWWNNQTNLWENLIIPETIDYNNETYIVTSIASSAFYQCTSVKTITLPKTITTINSNAFYWCVNLTSINIPEKLTVIRSNAFNNCRSVTSFEIPKEVTTIENKAFFDCKGWVGTITIPSSCTSIGTDAFSWCTGITGIVFEDGESPLSLSYAYSTSIYYEGTDAAKYRGLFADCPIKNAYIGRNLSYPTKNGEVCSPFKSISNYCTETSSLRSYCGKSFTSIQFGENVTIIPDEMFWRCGVKIELILPLKLKTIGSEAFYESFSNTYSSNGQITLTLPSTLESISKYAFYRCNNLRIVQSEATTPPSLPETSSDDPFTNCDMMVIVPNGAGESYRNHAIWGKKNILDRADELITVNVKTAGSLESRLLAKGLQLKDIRRLKLQGTLNEEDWNTVILMGNLNECDLSELVIEEIPNKVFRWKTSLLEIKLPQSLTAISDSTFYNCTHLQSDIEIPASCQNIGKYAFYNTLINSVTFPDIPICIGNYALGRCYNLQELELYGEGTVVNSDAFFNSRIERLYIGKGVQVETDAFRICTNIRELILEDGVKKMAKEALDSYLPNIKKVTFNGSVEVLEEQTWNSNLEEVHIKDVGKWCSLAFPTLETNPLYYAKRLYVNDEEAKEITIPSTVICINDYAFYNCLSLEKVTLPETVTHIGKQAFRSCSSLSEINLPNSLLEIGEEAFYSCSSLSMIDFPVSVSSIGLQAFSGCTNLKEIYAHWEDPIYIANKYAFGNISSSCLLYIPILTASRYSSNGWTMAKKEVGILTITTNDGGQVIYKENSVCNDVQKFQFNPYSTLSITINTDDGYILKSITINGEDVCSTVVDNTLTIEDVDENIDLFVEFAYPAPSNLSISVSSLGLATYCPAYPVDFTSAEKIWAYKAAVNGSSVKLTKVSTVAAGEGVLLRALSGGAETEELPITEATTMAAVDNEFVGTLVDKQIYQIDGDKTNYVLSGETTGVGFYKAKLETDGGTIVPAGKAYLPVTTSSLNGVNSFSIGWDDDAITGIVSVKTGNDAEPIYNLQGIRIKNAGKGIYIRNGKKIVIK